MNDRGYTLVELLLAVTICAVVISSAYPSIQAIFKRQEATRVIDNLKLLIQNGKIHALTTHRPLTLCGSSNSLRCNASWSDGILLLEDANRNGQVDGNDKVLQFVALNIQPSILSWNGFGGSRLTIENTGITFAGNGTFTYCRKDQDPLYRRQLVINRGGRIRLSRDQNHDGIHEDSTGNPIQCR